MSREAGLRADLLREWDSSPPIVVVVAIVAVIATTPVIITAVTTVVSEPVDVADETQLALDLRPVRRYTVVKPTRSRNGAVQLLSFLQHASSFVGAAIQITAIADTRLQIACGITKLVDLIIDSIFTL